MKNHLSFVEWTYPVPPSNVCRLCIMQRQDGPFAKDTIGGAGHYYTSIEDIRRGVWEHRTGSSTGGHASFAIAFKIAEAQWTELQA